MDFQLVSDYKPTGDQPEAIEKLTWGVKNGLPEQVLLGVTGSGKTFTMANIIANCNRPALVLAHNKTLAAQLCSEFRAFFPHNAVEYFVSYYDYYQPEAYIAHTDTYIEKDASINEEIDPAAAGRDGLAAGAAGRDRRGIGKLHLRSRRAGRFCAHGYLAPPWQQSAAGGAFKKAHRLRYERNDIAFERNMFRVRGDTVEIFPAYWRDKAIRVEYFGDEIERISEINPLTGAAVHTLSHTAFTPRATT